jgi:hypothetical protein
MLRRATVPTSHNQNSGLEYLLVSTFYRNQSGSLSCKPLPSTNLGWRGLDYFLFADNPSDIQHAQPLESELTRPRYRPLSDTVCSSRL